MNIKGSGGGGCFFEGAIIQTSHGNKPIEIIRKNQLVVGFDAFGILDFGVVTEVFKHHKSEIDPIVQVILTLSNGKQFDSTDNHIIPCNESFKAAEDIIVGDTVYDIKNNPLTVESIEVIPRPDVEFVYNLTIEPQHTFIANGLRVHNGGKKKKGARPPVEAANTLRSTALARTIEFLSEGEIVGLINGAKSIYFDDTPVQAADGSFNYNRVAYAFRYGTPGQSYVPGFSSAEASFAVSTEIKTSSPVIRTTSTANVDAVRVIIQLDEGLSVQDTTTGDVNGSFVAIEIDRRIVGGVWELALSDGISGKTMSVYQRNYRINRPVASGQWEFRVRRLTADSTKVVLRNKTSCYGYVEIIDAKLIYDEVAYVALAIDSESVGGTAPTRSYDIFGLKVKYPSNYDPILRTYTGVWNGTFVTGWTDNPAWAVYDLLTNSKHGAGEYIDSLTIDKWSFYQAAVYNDGLVPDGNGGMEPRFTFNAPISTSTGIWNLIQSIASVCRAVVFFGGGTIRLVQDRPANPVKLITNADVANGEFSYTGSGLIARHTAANVTYNDELNKYLPRVISIQDSSAVTKYGYNVTDVAAYGAVTEGQARRFGKWLIDTEVNQTESVSFNVSFNHMDLVPGDVIKLMDNNYAGAQLGGKIELSSANTVLHLDREVDLLPSTTYTISVLSSDSSQIYERVITNVAGKHKTLTFSASLFDTIPPGHPWILSSNSVKPRLFRVVGIQEQNKNQFGISAVFYDPNKYARVELGIVNPPDVFSAFTENEVGLVNNVRGSIEGFVDPVKGPIVNLHIFWDKPTNSKFALYYTVRYNFNDGQYSDSVTTDQLDYIIRDVTQGEFQVLITAYNITGVQGQTYSYQYIFNYEGSNLLNPPINLRWNDGVGTNFDTPNLAIAWDANPANEQISQAVGGYRINVEDLVDSEFLFSDVVGQNITSYIIPHSSIQNYRQLKVEVFTLDSIKRDSATAITVNFTNPAPSLPTSVDVDDGIDRVEVTVSGNTENDLAGLLVWLSDTPSFTPSSENLVYDGLYKDTVFIDVWAGTYYLRMAAYDSYSKNDLNISSQFTAQAINFADVAVPDIPTGLTLSSKLEVQPNGSQTASLIATWDSATHATEYILQMRDVTALTIYSESIVSGLRYTWTGLVCANTYGVKVKARNISVDSDYSNEETIVTAKDTVPPGPVTNASVDASFKNVWLEWENPSDNDLAGVQIWVNTINDRSTAELLATPNDNVFNHGGLGTGQTRYYWLRAIDRSDNVSTWVPTSPTAGLVATTVAAIGEDIANAVITGDKIANEAISQSKLTEDLLDLIEAGGFDPTPVYAAINTEKTDREAADIVLQNNIDGVDSQLDIVEAVAASKVKTYRQGTAPTGTHTTGDIWIDTANNNKIKRWSGSAWVDSDDTRIAVNAAAITDEQTARANADSALATNINNVSAIATSKNKTYRQTAAPTDVPAGTLVSGDLWFDSDDSNKPYRWSGSAWVATDDARIGVNAAAITAEQTARANADGALASDISAVQAIANAKNRTYRQGTAPVNSPPGTLVVGDIWYNTADNNKTLRWSGSAWVATDNALIAANTAAINDEATARANADTAEATARQTAIAQIGYSVNDNLIANPNFSSDAQLPVSSDSQGVVTIFNRSDSGVPADCPAATVARFQRVSGSSDVFTASPTRVVSSPTWHLNRITVAAGDVLQLSGWFYCAGTTGTNARVGIRTFTTDTGTTQSDQVYQNYNFTTGGWQKIDLSLTVSATGKSAVNHFALMGAAAVNAAIWFCDMDLRKQTTQLQVMSAAVQTTSQAIADTNGDLAAMYNIKTQLTVGGVPYIAGIGVGVENTSGIITTQILLSAQRIIALNEVNGSTVAPFIVDNGVVYINTAVIKDASILSAKIADAAIVNAKIADLAVDAAKIANATITNAKIANLTIESGKIKDAQITTAKIADLAVTFAKIADATITTAKIGDAQITTAKINDLAVTDAKIANLSVTNGKIANLAVNEAKIADATITAAKITDATITGAKIANATIAEGNIANAAITNAKIASAAIKEANIDNLAVTNAKIALATITGAKIANATIETGNIANASITNAKIADLQVDSLKIANGAVSSTQVQAPYLGWNFNWIPHTRDTHVFDIRFWIPVAGYKYQGYMKFDVKFTFHIAPTSTPYVMAQQRNNPPFASIRTVLDIHNESVPGGWHMFSRDNTQSWTFGQNNPWWYDVYFSGYLWFDFNAQLLFRLSVQPTPGIFLSTGGDWIPTNFAYDHYTVGVSTLYK